MIFSWHSNKYDIYQMTVDFYMVFFILRQSLINIFERFKYKEFVKIDGSFGEGGGQIIRNSMSYAAILRKPIFINNIRAGREIPGLRDQHSTGISLIYQICSNIYCNQQLIGNYKTSTKLKYFVGNDIDQLYQNKQFYNNKELHYFVDSQSKASISLIIQICLPVLLFLPHKTCVKIIGGTNASQHAPHIDYLINILKPTLYRLMNININIRCEKRGYLSTKGGGICILETNPVKTYLPAFDLTVRGNQISKINGICIIHTSLYHQNTDNVQQIANFLVNSMQTTLQNKFPYLKSKDITIKIEIDDANLSQSCNESTVILQLFAETDTKCLFGAEYMETVQDINLLNDKNEEYIKLNINMLNNDFLFEKMAQNVCDKLIMDYNCSKYSCIDKYLQDQLIIFMALSCGISRMIVGSFEEHTRTSIYFAELITDAKFRIQKYDKTNQNDNSLLIECQGVGFNNKFL